MKDRVWADYSGENTATLYLDRPSKRNAMTLDMWRAVPAALDKLAADPALRVLLVRGGGEETFCAGADINEFQSARHDASTATHYDEIVGRAEKSLAEFPKPTVALVRGHCIGGGCGLALCCDLRVCDESATFGITASKVGIVYGLGATRRLVQLVGPSRAKDLLFTGEIIGAKEANDIGLVDRLWPQGELEERATELADTIGARSQESVRGAKRVVEIALDGRPGGDEEARTIATRAYDSEDYREGVRAFIEGRSPIFTD